MYSLKCLNLTRALITVNCWWNAVYRRIFGYNKWESAKEVICRLGRLDIHHLFNQRHLLFMKRVAVSYNSIMTGGERSSLRSPGSICWVQKNNII